MAVTLEERRPELAEWFDATEQEKAVAYRYTRIRVGLRQYDAVLKIGVQSFTVCSRDDVREAAWHCWMIAKALISFHKEWMEG
jgi:hypothetical protein